MVEHYNVWGSVVTPAYLVEAEPTNLLAGFLFSPLENPDFTYLKQRDFQSGSEHEGKIKEAKEKKRKRDNLLSYIWIHVDNGVCHWPFNNEHMAWILGKEQINRET